MIKTEKKPVKGQRGYYLPKAKRGEKVQVYFNLNAMYNAQYGKVAVTSATMAEIISEGVAAANKRRWTKPNTWGGKFANMELAGSIYTVADKSLIIDHVRTGQMSDVVFTANMAKMKKIEKADKEGKSAKTPCCYMDGIWEGKLRKAAQEYYYTKFLLENDLPNWVRVKFNPVYNKTFMYITSEGKYEPIYSA